MANIKENKVTRNKQKRVKDRNKEPMLVELSELYYTGVAYREIAEIIGNKYFGKIMDVSLVKYYIDKFRKVHYDHLISNANNYISDIWQEYKRIRKELWAEWSRQKQIASEDPDFHPNQAIMHNLQNNLKMAADLIGIKGVDLISDDEQISRIVFRFDEGEEPDDNIEIIDTKELAEHIEGD